LLKADEVTSISGLVANATFADGKLTASLTAKSVKENLQLDTSQSAIVQRVHEIILSALADSPHFQAAAQPLHIYPPIISKYSPGKYYGWHVDSPLMGNPVIRTDMAMTIFLSDPTTYEGGELLLQTTAGVVNFKPAKGDAVLYPCQYLHCVNEVKSGERLAAVTWVQSKVKSPEQREILFNLSQVHAVLHQKDMHAPETNLLLQSYSNLVRMWAEV
jgi:PKHD-type hydroxylase